MIKENLSKWHCGRLIAHSGVAIKTKIKLFAHCFPDLVDLATIYSLSIWRNIETYLEDLLTLLFNNLRAAFILSQHIDILQLTGTRMPLVSALGIADSIYSSLCAMPS